MNLIVGVGELLWDVYPDGRKVAGGAAFNFACHCHQLGHPAVIVSRVGDDALGRELRDEVRRLGLSDEHIQTDPDYPTGTVRVTLDAAGVPTYTITEDVAWDHIGEDGPLDEGLSHDTIAVCFGTLALRHPVSRETILRFVASGPEIPSAHRVLDANIRPPFAPAAATLGRCVDAADWVKVSTDDVRAEPDLFGVVERAWAADPDVRELPKTRVLTLGPDGCDVVTSDGRRVRVPGVPARVVDTVGAGDAFTAAMVCLHLEGRPLPECARFATYYAARVCEHHGATPKIDRREVEAAAFGT